MTCITFLIADYMALGEMIVLVQQHFLSPLSVLRDVPLHSGILFWVVLVCVVMLLETEDKQKH